jgi:predicted Zn-dependent protease
MTATNTGSNPGSNTQTDEASPLDDSSLFERALARYSEGAPLDQLIDDFQAITRQAPGQSAGWTCLAWLQLLNDQPLDALRTARTAVKLNPQDPQARVNLSLAMLETGTKGVREHIEIVQRVMVMAPELGQELQDSIADGLNRKPGWAAMHKVQAWLAG